MSTPPETERKAGHVSVDLTAEQKAKVRKLAAESGLSVSNWLRAVVTKAVERKAKFLIDFTEINPP